MQKNAAATLGRDHNAKRATVLGQTNMAAQRRMMSHSKNRRRDWLQPRFDGLVSL
jgi:hypothetical protein